jgi:heat shock protein HslJ
VPSPTRFALVLAAAALLASATACGGDDDGGAEDSPPLEGTAWTLVSGVDVPDDAVPTLTLADDKAFGFGGCNRFTGGYELDGDALTLGPLAATMMACEEPKMAAEQTYLPALEAVDAWAIEGGELVLSSGGEETLRFSADAASSS